MAVLTRKISRAKWEASEDLGEDEIQADAVSADLRTSGNTLSFWRCASGDDDALRRAVLALAAAAERVDRIDVAWLTGNRSRPEIFSPETDGRTDPIVI